MFRSPALAACVATLAAAAVVAAVPPARGAPPGDSLATGGAHRDAFARAGRLASHFAADVGFVVTAPARLRGTGTLQLAGVATITALLYASDAEISRGFHRSEGNPVYDAAMDVGAALDPIGYTARTVPYYLAGAAVGAAFGIEPLERAGLDILESHLLSGGIRHSAKLLIGRRRPHEGRGPRVFEPNGGTSFPSGHTSAAFQLATVVSHHVGSVPARIALFGLAGAVAFERVGSDSHWPSDVFVSGIEGALVARTVVRRNEERRAAEAAATFVLLPGDRGVVATWRF